MPCGTYPLNEQKERESDTPTSMSTDVTTHCYLIFKLFLCHLANHQKQLHDFFL